MNRRFLTTEGGAPVTDNQNSRSAGPGGPLLLEDHYLRSLPISPASGYRSASCTRKAGALTVTSR